jgi:hypothetical protein
MLSWYQREEHNHQRDWIHYALYSTRYLYGAQGVATSDGIRKVVSDKPILEIERLALVHELRSKDRRLFW